MAGVFTKMLPLLLPAVFVVFAGIITPSCTCHKDVAKEEANAITAPSSKKEPQTDPGHVTASVLVETLSGTPLSGMIPIVTSQPNAFDKPIASGAPSDASGRSSIRFPVDQKVALRAWDPSLLYFPNNFYDVLPGSGAIKDTLVVKMVKSASLEATLIGTDGTPLKNENAGIMLFHPVHGPWWPAEADCDENGTVTFYKIPPGSYVILLKVASGPEIELPESYIAPDTLTSLGAIQLQ